MDSRMSDTTSFTVGSISYNNSDLPPDAAQASHQFSHFCGLKYCAVCCEERSCTSYQCGLEMTVSRRVPLGKEKQPFPSSLKIISVAASAIFTCCSKPL